MNGQSVEQPSPDAGIQECDAAYIRLAQKVHTYLRRQSNLSPNNPGVNYLLGQFVDATLGYQGTDYRSILNSEAVHAIRPELLKMLSKAEYEMEVYWGEHFANKGSMQPKDLEEFWYRDCYAHLIAEELDALKEINIKPDHENTIVFIGSGPLPMTAIDMHLQTGAKIVCVDSDEKAVNISQKMIENLGLSDAIEVHHATGEQYDYTGSDIVFVASLISQKDDVIERIRDTAPEAIVGVRSVEGIKVMLYEPVSENAFENHGLQFAVKSEDMHGGSTVNTTNIYIAQQVPNERPLPRP